MIVWRIAKEKYVRDLSGRGAELNGGRWNSKGRPVLYTASTYSLALLESLAYTPMSILNLSFKYLKLEIPEKYVSIQKIKLAKLPDDWYEYPAGSITKGIGNNWIDDNKNLLLSVPSVMAKLEQNLLINPKHKNFSKIKILEVGDLDINERLLVGK